MTDVSADAALRDPYLQSSPGAAHDVVMGQSASPAGTVLPSPSAGVSPYAAAPLWGVAPLPPTPSTAGRSPGAAAGELSPAKVEDVTLSPVKVEDVTLEAPPSPLPWPTTEDGQEERVSFLNLAMAPPGDAESAAKRFLSLLTLHMEGQVTMEQAVPYGDITVHRGRAWPGGVIA